MDESLIRATASMHALLLFLGFKFSLDIYVIFLNCMGLSFDSFIQNSGPVHGPFLSQSWLLSSSVVSDCSPAARGAVSRLSHEGASWTVR